MSVHIHTQKIKATEHIAGGLESSGFKTEEEESERNAGDRLVEGNRVKKRNA